MKKVAAVAGLVGVVAAGLFFGFEHSAVAVGPVPAAVTVPIGADFQDFGNSNTSDCEVAAAGNLVILWDARRGVIDTSVVRDVERTWQELGHPAVGLYTGQFLGWWSDHALDGYKASWVDQGVPDRRLIEWDISHYGGVDATVHLSNAFLAGGWNHPVWSGTVSGPNQLQLDVVGYNRTGVVVVSWGVAYRATWQWFNSHVTDVFAVKGIRA